LKFWKTHIKYFLHALTHFFHNAKNSSEFKFKTLPCLFNNPVDPFQLFTQKYFLCVEDRKEVKRYASSYLSTPLFLISLQWYQRGSKGLCAKLTYNLLYSLHIQTFSGQFQRHSLVLAQRRRHPLWDAPGSVPTVYKCCKLRLGHSNVYLPCTCC